MAGSFAGSFALFLAGFFAARQVYAMEDVESELRIMRDDLVALAQVRRGGDGGGCWQARGQGRRWLLMADVCQEHRRVERAWGSVHGGVCLRERA